MKKLNSQIDKTLGKRKFRDVTLIRYSKPISQKSCCGSNKHIYRYQIAEYEIEFDLCEKCNRVYSVQ